MWWCNDKWCIVMWWQETNVETWCLPRNMLLCTTKYYSVPQSTTPVLLCTTKYYSVLQSTTRKYYSSTTFYYKVQLQYYSVLLQYYSSPNIVLRLSTQISANPAPANKSDTPTSPNNALATRSETPTWPNIAPATKSDTVTVPAVTSDQNLRSQATPRPGLRGGGSLIFPNVS